MRSDDIKSSRTSAEWTLRCFITCFSSVFVGNLVPDLKNQILNLRPVQLLNVHFPHRQFNMTTSTALLVQSRVEKINNRVQNIWFFDNKKVQKHDSQGAFQQDTSTRSLCCNPPQVGSQYFQVSVPNFQ